MGIVYQTDKRSGITYAYENQSFWDPELKRSKSKMFFAEVKCRLLQNAMYVGCCKIDLGGYTPKPL